MAIRFGGQEYEGKVLLLINGEPVASGSRRDMLAVVEERIQPGDRVTLLEAGWEEDE